MTTFSIATIIYNDNAHIKETMNSIINQSYKNIEYILIDGGSDDGSMETIYEIIALCATITHEEKTSDRLYLEATHKLYPTLTFKFLSEKDKGIYDAMNKGVVLASKEWTNFMNCGDRFYDLNVLQKVADLIPKEADVVYGDTEIFYPQQNVKLIKQSPIDLKKSLEHFGSNLIHQSIFFKTKIHKKHFYKTAEYKLASDYELIYRLYSQAYRFAQLHCIVSVFSTGGSSDIHGFLRTNESLQIAKLYGNNSLKNYLFFIIALSKKIIKTKTPKFAKFLLVCEKSYGKNS